MNRLPVLDVEDRPVGILARDDVVRAVARVLRECETSAYAAAHPGHPRLEAD